LEPSLFQDSVHDYQITYHGFKKSTLDTKSRFEGTKDYVMMLLMYDDDDERLSHCDIGQAGSFPLALACGVVVTTYVHMHFGCMRAFIHPYISNIHAHTYDMYDI
jgi:hypothetical protein